MAIAATIPDHLKKKPASVEKHDPDATHRKHWRTPYGFADFTTPVSYAEACRSMKILHDKYFKPSTGDKQ